MKQRDIVAVMILLLAGSLAMLWSMSFVRQASFVADAPATLVPRRGMYGSEQFPEQALRYRWTKGTSLVQIPYPGNASVVSLLLAGGTGRTVPVTLHVEPSVTPDTPDISFLVAPEPRTYTLLLPAVPTERVSLQMTAPTMRDPRNGQKLALVVGTIAVQGAGYLHWTWVVAGWLTLLALYAIVRRAGGHPWLAANIAVADLVTLLFWHVSHGWLYGLSTLLLGVQGGFLAAGWLASLAMKRDDVLVSVLLSVVSILVFVPVMAVQVFSSGDYMVHIGEAARMFRTGTLGFPHFLFQLCLLNIYALFPPGFEQGSLYAIYGILPTLVGDVGVYDEVSGLEVPAMITGVLLAWVTVVMIYRYVVSAVMPLSHKDVISRTDAQMHRPDKRSYQVRAKSYKPQRAQRPDRRPSHFVTTHPDLVSDSLYDPVAEQGVLTRADKLFVVLVVVLVMMATPITLFRWIGLDSLSYLGYIGTHAYHNPTFHLIKPIALVLFWFAWMIFRGSPSMPIGASDGKGREVRLTMVFVGATAALTALSALAKPSYIICLIPALMLGAGYRLVRRQSVRWVLLGVGVMIPAGMMLVWQYVFTYASAGPTMKESSIVLAPLKVMSLYSEWLLPKFLLSIVFPVCVYLLYARQAIASTMLNLAWGSFLVGAFFTYGVSETGERSLHGNFLWSAQIALFVLFVVSAAFVIRHYRSRHDGALYRMLLVDTRARVCLAVLGLHSISGIGYYLRALGGNVW